MNRGPLRRADVIAIGSELLGSDRLDTNSLFLSDRLGSLGIALRVKSVVGDDRGDMAEVFRQACDRADLIVLTGGLGPTDDDLTREVVSDVLGLPMAEEPAIVAELEKRFARRGAVMPPINRRQAMVPRGATVLANPNGSAPGLMIEHGERVVVLLPGPPRELQPMFDALCAGPLSRYAGDQRVYRASLFIAGRGESDVDQRAAPVYRRWSDAVRPIATTILASPGQVELHLSTRDRSEADARERLDAAVADLVAVLGADVYSIDGRRLEEVVGDRLRARGLTIAAAESCTGGLFTSRLTDVPGSSAYVHSAVVAYDNAAKTSWLGVAPESIERFGAVSEPVAMAMAEGIRGRTGAGVGVGITGIAGPGGGTPEKPVGTVAIAVVVPDAPAYVHTFRFIGGAEGRALIKLQASQAALDRVRRLLER
ncbi:MAG TPA: competence/damage-inducible protein A [Vicinamibacterales bacterium]|nr:competence/damage-inducible protein A [Vicinamibacterales bacterium]